MKKNELILERLYSCLKIEKDIDFAKIAGMTKSALSNHRQKGTLPINHIIDIATQKNISLDYIFGIAQNDYSSLYPVLDDLYIFDKQKVQNILENALIESILLKFQNNQHSQILKKIFWAINAEAGAGIQARPLLFLYYILKGIEKEEFSPDKEPKEMLVTAIKNTKFSWAKFGPEFGESWKNKVILYVQNIMEKNEAQLILDNLDSSINIIEKMLPPAMKKAHISP